MSNELIGRSLALLAIPLLIATAAIAQGGTPEEQSNSQQSSEEKEDPVIAQANRDKARAEALKATAEAQKAAREADAAAGSSLFGPLGATDLPKGKVTVDDSERGELEATLLSALAMQEAVEPLAAEGAAAVRRLNAQERLAYACQGDPSESPDGGCFSTPRPQPDVSTLTADDLCTELARLDIAAPASRHRAIIVVAEDVQGPAALAETFDAQTSGMARGLCAAIEHARMIRARHEAAARRAGVSDSEAAGGTGLAAVGAVVSTVANLLRTDYTIYGIALQSDQNLLVRELAGALLSSGIPNPVFTPSLFPVGRTTNDNPALWRIALLDALRMKAADAAATQAQLSQAIAQRSAHATGQERQALSVVKGDYDAAKARLDAAIKGYGDLMAALTSREGDQPPPLTGIIRQAQTAALLRDGALLVVTKVHFTGGTAFTRENFFSSLFGMPYRVSGGVLISSVLQDGRTGRVLQTGMVPVSGGFYGPTQIRRVLQEAQARRARRGRAE